jgi:hypothetical protein
MEDVGERLVAPKYAVGTGLTAKELRAAVLCSGCYLWTSPEIATGVMALCFKLAICVHVKQLISDVGQESGQPHRVLNLQYTAASEVAHNNVVLYISAIDALDGECTDHQGCH